MYGGIGFQSVNPFLRLICYLKLLNYLWGLLWKRNSVLWFSARNINFLPMIKSRLRNIIIFNELYSFMFDLIVFSLQILARWKFLRCWFRSFRCLHFALSGNMPQNYISFWFGLNFSNKSLLFIVPIHKFFVFFK